MRTAFVTSSVSRDAGGLFFAMTSLARSLHGLGVDVAVEGVRDAHSLEDAGKWAPVLSQAHPRKGPGSLAYAPGLAWALDGGGFDLVHTHGIWQWPSAAVHGWHHKTGKPYLVSPHGMLDPWALAQSSWKKRLVSVLYESAHLRDAACIHALCQSEADSIRAYGLKKPVCIIPNGVDLPVETQDRFAPRQKTEDREQETGDGGQGTGDGGQGTGDGGRELSVVRSPLSVVLDVGAGGFSSSPQIHGSRGERSNSSAIDRQQTTDNGQRILLFLGRLHPKKGIANALRAWRRCQETGGRRQEEWQFVIAGWDQGGHEAELKRLCDEIGLAWGGGEELSVVSCRLSDELGGGAQHSSSARQLPGSRVERSATTANTDNGQRTTDNGSSVVFFGPTFGEAKDALLRRADAFILPSFSEGLPMSVLEAMAYRLPVLMTDHCNLPEGFAANAALRIGTDTESIAEGMRLILRSPTSDLRALGQNGRALVERQFTWPQVAAQMKEVYEWVLGGGEAPTCVMKPCTMS